MHSKVRPPTEKEAKKAWSRTNEREKGRARSTSFSKMEQQLLRATILGVVAIAFVCAHITYIEVRLPLEVSRWPAEHLGAHCYQQIVVIYS